MLPMLSRLRTPESVVDNFSAWLGRWRSSSRPMPGWPCWSRWWSAGRGREHEPCAGDRARPVDPFARQFVYFFAIVPALAATFVAVLIGSSGPVGGVAPLVILSGLAVVIAAGDDIELSHQHVVISAWFGLLFVPPAMAVVALLALPWLGVDLSVNQPARPMAQFFADSFQRRVGAPLPIVAGDPRTAALDRARRAEPAEPLPRRHARALALGDHERRRSQGRDRGLADDRHRRHAAAGDQGALPGHRAGSAARVRAAGAGTVAAVAHRLGDDPAAAAATRRGAGRA